MWFPCHRQIQTPVDPAVGPGFRNLSSPCFLSGTGVEWNGGPSAKVLGTVESNMDL